MRSRLTVLPTSWRGVRWRFFEPGGRPGPELTPRERQVTTLAAMGKSNEEIAKELTLSVLTIRTHIHRAMTKLNARDRAQLVAIAYQTGLVQPGPRVR